MAEFNPKFASELVVTTDATTNIIVHSGDELYSITQATVIAPATSLAAEAKTAAATADGKAVAADTKATNAATAASTADGKAVAAQTTANQAKATADSVATILTKDGKLVKLTFEADGTVKWEAGA